MSHVADVILVADTYLGGDWAKDRLGPINAWLAENHHRRGLVSAEDPSLPPYWYGGGKSLQCEVAIGAFNYLAIPDFLAFLRSFPWTEDDGTTQVLIKDEQQAGFTLHDIHTTED